MPIVYEDLDLPDSATPTVSVSIRLAGAGGRPVAGRQVSTGKLIVGTLRLTNGQGIDQQGIWSEDLASNTDILPEGTTWFVERVVGCDQFSSYLSVPITGGPYEAFTLEADPLNSIDPGVLAAHAADLLLHGGGIEVDYAEITSSVIVTGSGGGLTAAAVPGLQIDVPDLARPVYIYGHLPALQTSGGPTEQSWGIFHAGSLGAFVALDAQSPGALNTTTVRKAFPFARIPAHSADSYVIGGTGSGGNLTARLNPSSINKACMYAIAR